MQRRALVIILRTQAHIYFIAGTSQIVHLPFEVENVFPLPQGLIFQRKLQETKAATSTHQVPPAPRNTFAFSQTSPFPTPNRNASPSAPGFARASPFLPLLSGPLQKSNGHHKTDRSGLACLIDPLTEVGAVTVKNVAETRPSHDQHLSSGHSFSSLDPEEILIYISAHDELGQSSSWTRAPLTFAVTQNCTNGQISLWSVRYLDYKDLVSERAQTSRSTTAAFSRRRSSYGLETGITTPHSRVASQARENAIMPLSQNYALHKNASDSDPDPLDLAFDNPMEPAKSSRRVSSLLARADLAASSDMNTFSDSILGHGKRRNRRGASSGPYTSRIGTGADGGGRSKPSKPLSDIRSSMDSITLSEIGSRASLAANAEGIHEKMEVQSASTLYGSSNHLRTEVIFQKIHDAGTAVPHSPGFGACTGTYMPKVCAMSTSKINLGSSMTTAFVTILVARRDKRDMLDFQIEAIRPRHTQKEDTAKVRHSSSPWKFRHVTETRKTGVWDICIFREGKYWRMIKLSEDLSGMRELSLQTPWGTTQKINLPSPLNLYNPFQISDDISLRRRREGGLKRLLSGVPLSLEYLQHGSLHGCVDVLASDGSRHCIHIQLEPSCPHVRRIIEVCEAILPDPFMHREVILQAWCEVASWLKYDSEEETDLEWTAMVVVLFSLAVPFISHKGTDIFKQQKRRKGDLLRSSSGANTDLGNWETMINQEHSFTSATPKWMIEAPWEWTKDEAMPVHPTIAKKPQSSTYQPSPLAVPIVGTSSLILHYISLSRRFTRSAAGQGAVGQQGYLPTAPSHDSQIRRTTLASILIALHLLREEYKLDVLAAEPLHKLTPILAQIGGWLGWENWGYTGSSAYVIETADMEHWHFDDSRIPSLIIPPEPFPPQPFPPPSIYQYIESAILAGHTPAFASLVDVASPSEVSINEEDFVKLSQKKLLGLTPRTVIITNLLRTLVSESTEARIPKMASWGLTLPTLETMPESVAALFRTFLIYGQIHPSTEWDYQVSRMVGRDDLAMLEHNEHPLRGHGRDRLAPSNEALRDVYTICHTAFEVDMLGPYDGSAEFDRQSITRLLFKEDQRFAEAAKLVHPLLHPVALCATELEWSDTDHLEAQQELVKIIALRTLSVSLGRGLVFYNARMPILTEKFPIHGFTLSCVMKPGDTTVTADRTAYTEEKVCWAFFHAGVEAGLSISTDAHGVDTSWILFNKPRDLNNRHAGFLLAMGLNGHLKSIAKWVAFKYLTPKHSMTSVGLLLGLSASHLGTMDTLVTRLLSVHVTRMLPVGAAELNLSPLTQTSGIMGIGLLYCNTQHRRMSEIVLSEMENAEEEESANPLENLRDEGYRLAAGFALGYINIGKGSDLLGLRDMHITERLLALAVAAKRADRVHILDRATAGATIAIALIFMKSHDRALARKIDIPDTLHQFEYVRPDHFLLRTVAKHLIVWDEIRATGAWMRRQLPLELQRYADLTAIHYLTSEDLPLLNIIAGLCFAIGLRYAGSGFLDVRDLLCNYLDHFIRVCRLPTLNYDGKLARITVRNCQDLVSLSAACVMAGTGDIPVFRRLRSLHGRTDPETPYGSHLATHLAIGLLFLGGGTHTLGTSDLAVASLLCAFYPLFPTAVLDNKSHLQAFRHLWVLAAERRCLVARDVDSQRPIAVPILVTLVSNFETAMITPCLLPEVHTISKIQTNDPEYWSVTLDFLHNPKHMEAFQRHQSIYLRRRAPYDAHTSVFSATMQALNDSLNTHELSKRALNWIFTLPAFQQFNKADQAMVLPNDPSESFHKGTRGTVLDDRLVLKNAFLDGGRSERLWNLRLLLAWAEGRRKRGEDEGNVKEWISQEIVEKVRAGIVLRRRGR